MSEAEARKHELEARNAGLRGQIDSMLADLRRRTARLGEMRDEAAQRITEVTSQDGLVTVTMDAAGTLQELTLSPKAFERNTPERLARTITSAIREASGGVQQSLQETFGPMTEGGPEIADVVTEMPLFKDILGDLGPLVPPPDPATERARQADDRQPRSGQAATAPAESRPATSRSTQRSDDFDDDPPDSFLMGGKW